MRILFTGGGTGGHIYPIVAVARVIKNQPLPAGEKLELYFAGPADFPVAALASEGIKISRLPAGRARRYFSLLNFLSPLATFLGFLKALFVVWRIMPDVIWAKGAYGSVAVGLVGWLYRIPIFIHESDAVPGAANLFLRHLATRVAVAFPTAAAYFKADRTAVVGNPVRAGIIGGKRETTPKSFTLSSDRPVILILGGSQGAARINALVAQTMPMLLKEYGIIHQCGQKNFESFKKELTEVFRFPVPGTPHYELRGLLAETELGEALAAAALVVSRAGAGSIFDIALSGKPSILIPLKEAASRHQERNAFDYARAGAAVVLEEANLTPHLFINEIHRVMNNKNLQTSLSQAARKFARPDASQRVAEELLKLVAARFPGLFNPQPKPL